MRLKNNGHKKQHVETSDGAVIILPGEEKLIDDNIIYKFEFSRIPKIMTVLEQSKVRKQKSPEKPVGRDRPILKKEYEIPTTFPDKEDK